MRASPAGSQDTPTNRYMFIWHTIVRMFFPIWFAYLLIMFAFRIGVKRRDKCARPVRRLGLGLPNPLAHCLAAASGCGSMARPGGRAPGRPRGGAGADGRSARAAGSSAARSWS